MLGSKYSLLNLFRKARDTPNAGLSILESPYYHLSSAATPLASPSSLSTKLASFKYRSSVHRSLAEHARTQSGSGSGRPMDEEDLPSILEIQRSYYNCSSSDVVEPITNPGSFVSCSLPAYTRCSREFLSQVATPRIIPNSH